MKNLNLKKFFLYLLVASVAASALVGIGVMLFGDFGEFETKILVSAFTVTCASILGLACGAFLETKRGKLLPLGGIALAILSAVIWIVFIWDGFENEEFFVRIAFSATLLAASCSLVSLLSMATLDARFAWSRPAAHVSVWSLTSILLWLIWSKGHPVPDFVSRTIGILSIVVAALTIVTPVFHWLGRQKPATSATTANAETADIDAELARLRARIAELENRKREASRAAAE